MASGDSEIQDVTSNSGDKQQECEKAESPKPGCSKYDDTPVETPEVTARPESPEPNCSICLCAMTNKSFTDTCFHTFCFICLLEWSKVNPVCPLCKKKFDSIIHTVKSIDQYEQYYIPPRPQTPSPPPPDLSRLWDSAGLRFRYASTLVDDPWGEYDDHRYWRSRRHDAVIGLDPRELLAQRRAHTFHASQYRSRRSRVSSATLYRRMRERHTRDFRRRIYMEGLWAVHQDNTRRYRDISPEFFTRNPAQIHRLVPWLNRELNAILYNQEETVSFALQLVMELTKRYELQSDEMHQHLESILGLHTRHFLHEYYCFARSPFDMTDYDTHAEYEQVLSVSGSDQDSDEDQRMGNTGVVQHQRNGRDASGSESSRDNLRGARRRKNSRVRRNADAGQGSSNTRSSRTHGINNASALSSIAYNLPSNRTLGGQGSWQSDFRNPEPIAERRNSSPVDFTPAPIVSRVRDFLEEVSDPNNASTSRSGWESPVLSRTTIFSSPPRAESPVIDIVSVTSTPENNPEVQNNSSSPECIDQKSPEYINPGSPETIDPGSAEDIKPGTSGVLNLSKDVEHVLASSNTQDSDSDSDVQFIKFEKPWGERTPIHLSSGPDSDIELLTKSSPFRKRKREKNRSQTRSKTRSRSRTRRRDRRSQTPLQYRQGRYRSSDRSERYLNKYSSKSREHTQHKHSHDRYRSVSRTRDRYHSKFRKSKSNSNKPGEMEKEKTEKNTRDSQKYEKLGKSTKRSVTGESERHEDYFRLSRYMSHNSSRRHYEKRLKSPSYTSKHKHKKKKDKRHRSRSVELVKVKRKHKHRSRSRKSKKSKKDIHRGYSYDEKSPIHIVEEVLPLSKHKEVTKKYKKNPTGHKSSTKKLSSKVVPVNATSNIDTVAITSPSLISTSSFGSPLVSVSTSSAGFSSPLPSNQSGSECIQSPVAPVANWAGVSGSECTQSPMVQNRNSNGLLSHANNYEDDNKNKGLHSPMMWHMDSTSFNSPSDSNQHVSECSLSPVKQNDHVRFTAPSVKNHSDSDSFYSSVTKKTNSVALSSPLVNNHNDEHILSPVTQDYSSGFDDITVDNLSDITVTEAGSSSEIQNGNSSSFRLSSVENHCGGEGVHSSVLQNTNARFSSPYFSHHSVVNACHKVPEEQTTNKTGISFLPCTSNCRSDDDFLSVLLENSEVTNSGLDSGGTASYESDFTGVNFSESVDSLTNGQSQSNSELKSLKGQSDDTDEFDINQLLQIGSTDNAGATRDVSEIPNLDEMEKQLRESIQSRVFK